MSLVNDFVRYLEENPTDPHGLYSLAWNRRDVLQDTVETLNAHYGLVGDEAFEAEFRGKRCLPVFLRDSPAAKVVSILVNPSLGDGDEKQNREFAFTNESQTNYSRFYREFSVLYPQVCGGGTLQSAREEKFYALMKLGDGVAQGGAWQLNPFFSRKDGFSPKLLKTADRALRPYAGAVMSAALANKPANLFITSASGYKLFDALHGFSERGQAGNKNKAKLGFKRIETTRVFGIGYQFSAWWRLGKGADQAIASELLAMAGE
jgi:hypothetical protein